VHHRAPSVQLQHHLPRGVYEAPYYDTSGAILLIAVTRTHRLLSYYRVRDAADYEGIFSRLHDELDAFDPVMLRLEV